jgi:hypothetical protein
MNETSFNMCSIPAPTRPRVARSISSSSAPALALRASPWPQPSPVRGVLSNLPNAHPNLLHNAEFNAPLVAVVDGVASVSHRPPVSP